MARVSRSWKYTSLPHATAMLLLRDHVSGYANGSAGTPGPSSASENCFRAPRLATQDVGGTLVVFVSSCEKLARRGLYSDESAFPALKAVNLSVRSSLSISPKTFAIRRVRGVVLSGT
jgi:hypothetical protein